HSASLVALDATGGRLRWADQVHPHDQRNLDLNCPPMLLSVTARDRQRNLVIVGGKDGLRAWERTSRRRLWRVALPPPLAPGGGEGGPAHHGTGGRSHGGSRGPRLLRVQQSPRQDVRRRRTRSRDGRHPLAALAACVPVRPTLGRWRRGLLGPRRREAPSLASMRWGGPLGVASRLADRRRAPDRPRGGLPGEGGRGGSAGGPAARRWA